MTNSLIPYSFVPGTKAMASEVNANFIALANIVEDGKTFTTESIEEFGTNMEARLDEALGNRLESDLSNCKNISNCILEIPQNIKYEIASSSASVRMIKLLAGSKVYVSTNGTFEPLILTSDTSFGGNELWTTTHDRSLFLVYIPETNSLDTSAVGNSFSQSAAPTDFLAGRGLWFDTNSNVMKFTRNSGATWQICSLPLMVGRPGENSVGWHGYIDTVFNGFGFIGQYTFTLPGVRYLLANGRNSDGSLKNIECKTTEVIITSSVGASSYFGFLTSAGVVGTFGVNQYYEQDTFPKDLSLDYALWYDTFNNQFKRTSSGGQTWNTESSMYFGKLRKESNGNITSMEIPQPFNAIGNSHLWQTLASRNAFAKRSPGYYKTIFGLIIQWGYASNNAVITFPTPFPAACVSVQVCGDRSVNGQFGSNYATSLTTTTFKAVTDNCNFWWFAIGY